MGEAYIVGAVRSPIGRKKGKLSGLHPTDLLGTVLKGLLERAGVDPLQVDEVFGGCVTQTGEQGVNVTRNAWIAAGLPWDVPCVSVDSQCGSSQQALHSAAAGVMSGQLDLAIAGGVEAMSRVGLGANGLQPGFPFSENWIDAVGLEKRARFHAFAIAGTTPVVMLKGPVPVTKKIFTKTGMGVGDIDLFECNEAMGSIMPMWLREFDVPVDKVNVTGSGISLGHPVGATGARMTVTLLHELERTGKRFGFQTMCEGGGQAHATIIERLD